MVEVACPTTRQGLAAEAAGGGDKRMKNATKRAGVYLLAAVVVVALGCGGDGNTSTPTTPTTTTDLSPSFPSGHSLTVQPGEQYTVGVVVNVTLPAASGGDPPLTYTVSPSLPSGLTFGASTRTITGTPTTAQTHREYSYRVTDADGDTASIGFGITVAMAPTMSSGACFVGQELNPGDFCTVGSERFEVLADGRGRYGCCITAGTGVNINGFRANRISGTDTWRIEAVP